MCCATRFTIAAQPTIEALPTLTFVAKLAVLSTVLPHLPEANKAMGVVVIACTLFKAIILQI